jgi:NADPH2:quinone reductase
MKAIRVHAVGGPEVLRLEDVDEPQPGPGQVLVKIAATGVNFIDVYHRTGLYPQPLPFVPGHEAAGTVVAVGEGVTGLRVGDRVASAEIRAAYAERAVVREDRVIKLPAGLDLRTGAAAMLQGMTAHYLVTDTFHLGQGQSCLVHAAAGGVGLLLVQMAKQRGARVLGTTSTEAKAQLAREAGADEVVLYEKDDFEAAAKRFTDGRGVDVVYDSVGRTTFAKSLASLAHRGMLVLYGQSSGAVPPVEPSALARASLFLTRPTLFHYVAERAELEQRAADVLGAVQKGELKLRIDSSYPLAEAREAHRVLEGRQTTGKVLLEP